MLSLFSGFDRLRSLVKSARQAEKINEAFARDGYPPVVYFGTESGVPYLNTEYRIDLSSPPRFVWFRLAEVYIQFLPEMEELTYDVRKNRITRVKSLY